MRPSLLVQNVTIALLFALACYVVARYGLDAVVNQTMLENEFFHGRSKVSHRVN
jgi:hypothetical protein